MALKLKERNKTMKAARMLRLSDDELERMREKRTIPLGVYEHYVIGLEAWAESRGKTLEEAVEHAFNAQNEHVVFYIKAYQHLKGR